MNTSIKLRRIFKHFSKRHRITNVNLKERQPLLPRIFIQTAYFGDTVQGNRRWIGEVIGDHDWVVEGWLEKACDGVCSDVATSSCYENTRSWGSHVVLYLCVRCSLVSKSFLRFLFRFVHLTWCKYDRMYYENHLVCILLIMFSRSPLDIWNSDPYSTRPIEFYMAEWHSTWYWYNM